VRFKNECFIYYTSLTLQWTPLLLVVSTFACENTHRVALGLDEHASSGDDCHIINLQKIVKFHENKPNSISIKSMKNLVLGIDK